MFMNAWFVMCMFVSPKQESMDSDKLSDRQHLLQRLLEAIKQVAKCYCLPSVNDIDYAVGMYQISAPASLASGHFWPIQPDPALDKVLARFGPI